MAYREAWKIQKEAHAQVLAGGQEHLFFVEHHPVITFGRRSGVARNLLASEAQLVKLQVEVVQSDRGGDITFHGPGQIVAYPILRLNDHGFSVGGYVHALEQAVIETLAEFGIRAQTDKSAVGVWIEDRGPLAKICALGVRIKQGVSLHGLALNVNTDLSYFNLIVPCGLSGRPVTSVQTILSDQTPSMERLKASLESHLVELRTSK